MNRPQKAPCSKASRAKQRRKGVSGFTLLEVTIALVLMMIVALGAASLFSFAIYNNSGGYDRAQSLAIAQEALEGLRKARFSFSTTDALLNAGSNTQNNVIREGRFYTVTTTIQDVPPSSGTTATLKNITITVRPEGAGLSWATKVGGTVTIKTQRAKSDQV